jgi:hypothetical protein
MLPSVLAVAQPASTAGMVVGGVLDDREAAAVMAAMVVRVGVRI